MFYSNSFIHIKNHTSVNDIISTISFHRTGLYTTSILNNKTTGSYPAIIFLEIDKKKLHQAKMQIYHPKTSYFIIRLWGKKRKN